MGEVWADYSDWVSEGSSGEVLAVVLEAVLGVVSAEELAGVCSGSGLGAEKHQESLSLCRMLSHSSLRDWKFLLGQRDSNTATMHCDCE